MTDLLRVEDLKVHFGKPAGLFQTAAPPVRAVDGVSFGLRSGETLGLVGESGCGKSTVGRAVLGLIPPTSGQVMWDGQPRAETRRREMQMVFQDPFTSLNPRMTAADIVAEPLRNYRVARGRALRDRVSELFESVGLRRDQLDRYPHEFSGGQRQRLGIARALALEPRMIVCDEAVSALDVSVQAQIVNLLSDLRRDRGLSYLFISHDLSVVRHIADRVAVMYLGRIVEIGSASAIFERPAHPYTRALIEAAPKPVPGRRPRQLLTGEIPSPARPPAGCRFHTRCPLATEQCRQVMPVLTLRGDDHAAACHMTETTPFEGTAA